MGCLNSKSTEVKPIVAVKITDNQVQFSDNEKDEDQTEQRQDI